MLPPITSQKERGIAKMEHGFASEGDRNLAEAAASMKTQWTLLERVIWRTVAICNGFGIYSSCLTLALDCIAERRDQRR